MKKQRQVNYELLRIVAMLMIVCLHYLGKGGALANPSETLSRNGYIAWLVEAFCIVAVNVYVLISGYFGINASFSIKKLLGIWLQVWFYSVVIGSIFAIVNKTPIDIYKIFMYIFPIVTKHYWFATYYVLLYLLMPMINAGVEKLEKKKLQSILLSLIILLSVAKTVIPMQLPVDFGGYDTMWLICMYLTGAYIRKYGKDIKLGTKIAMYVGSVALIYISFLIIRVSYHRFGILGEFIEYSYSYNFIFTYIGSIGFFLMYGHVLKVKEGIEHPMRDKVIFTLSKATFGVYLIHEQIDMRYLWQTWFKCKKFAKGSSVKFVIHMICTVMCVYLVCTAIELIRQQLFDKAGKILIKRNGEQSGR